MSITVKYFASLRESLGRREDRLETEGAPLTVAEVWKKVSGTAGTLPPDVLTAVNMEYVKPDAVVKDGDEIAFFPPVTGG